jgi:hypothetical protein
MPGDIRRPSTQPSELPQEQGSDPVLPLGLTAAERAQQIADQRQAATAAKLATLMENPRIVTLVETGQLTTGTALAREQATGTTELPKIRAPKRKPVNRRGGRSYPEPSDSELDPNWNAPADTTRTPEQAATDREQIHNLAESLRLKNEADKYHTDIEQGGVYWALARLRAHGFAPDPDTRGKTVRRIDSSQIKNVQ